ncbi:unnamed protein product [Paramecium octaurelia]|uniref:Tetratricopeptide repeat protein n=1 Tax=Paramecium octaurelia TaxID=43137 RepID=A0A8S1XC78_PAROT|nr:unnamed protein product [Paramecium octaurelia]
MEVFKCKYLQHENEEIMGFCLNQICQKANQFCYLCLTQNHYDHQKDCIRFNTMSQYINQQLKVSKEQEAQMKEMIDQMRTYLEEIYKQRKQQSRVLEIMNQRLQKQGVQYIQFYSKEIGNKTQQLVIELQQILNTIKNVGQVQTKINNQLIIAKDNYDVQMELKKVEASKLFDQGTELVKSHKFREALKIFDDSIKLFDLDYLVYTWKAKTLNQLKQYEQAIQCCNKSITLNPNYVSAWNNKGFALDNLNKYEDAIKCYNKALTLNPKNDTSWTNKGHTLNNLAQYNEAIQCFDQAITIYPNSFYAFKNKGLALHNLQQYQNAIMCYQKAIYIFNDPLILELMTDSLFQLGLKDQAKLSYLDAQQLRSIKKEYHQKQLLKI